MSFITKQELMPTICCKRKEQREFIKLVWEIIMPVCKMTISNGKMIYGRY
jgi:hypothetical protein